MILYSKPRQVLDEISYIILPGKLPVDSPLIEMHNQAYDYWCQFWGKVFEDNGVDPSLRYKDEFCRKELVCLLLHEGKIVGMHLCEFLNLNQSAFREHEYFSHHKGDTFLETLDRKRINHAMIMTYLTIDPEWRKKKVGVSLASVLMSLATKLQCAAGAEVNLGRAREDVGVDSILTDLGGVVLQDRLPMHNTPISIICIYSDKVKELSDSTARHFVEKFWTKRTDYSERSYSFHSSAKAVQFLKKAE
jgi:hypothetical protein